MPTKPTWRDESTIEFKGLLDVAATVRPRILALFTGSHSDSE